MPTTKERINITVDKDTNSILKTLAKRDGMSKSRKVLDLLLEALEIEEDRALASIVEDRIKDKANYISHEKAWKGIA